MTENNNKEFTEGNILWKNVATASSFNKKEQQVFNVNKNEILIAKVGDKFKAMQSRCPHAGLSMLGSQINSEKDLIFCKWHNTSFCYKDGKVDKWVDVPPYQKKLVKVLALFSKKLKQMVEMPATPIEIFKIQVIEKNVWVGIEVAN